jgi:hypothetical protein
MSNDVDGTRMYAMLYTLAEEDIARVLTSRWRLGHHACSTESWKVIRPAARSSQDPSSTFVSARRRARSASRRDLTRPSGPADDPAHDKTTLGSIKIM